MKVLISFIFIILQLLQSLSAKKYPSDLPRCFRDDSNLNDCLIKATEILKPRLKDGIKEYGLTSLNPYTIPSASFEQGTKAVNFKTSVTNFSIYGLDNYTFTEFSINPNTFHIHALITFGPLHASGECNFEGHLFVAPLIGKGTLILDTVPPTFTIDVNSELVQRSDVKYIQVNNASLRVENFGGKARFENFVGVNDNIVTAINRVIDENSDELLNEVKPLIVNFLKDFIVLTFGEIFRRYPLDEILPLSP